MSRPDEIKALFGQAAAAFGHVDILVNNAGIYEFADLASITPDSIDWMFGLNVKGLILATQAVAAAFPAKDGAAPFVARTLLRRIGQPADIAAAVSFVVSDEGGYITGETIQVAGGLRL